MNMDGDGNYADLVRDGDALPYGEADETGTRGKGDAMSASLRFTHVDDMRPDVAERARMMGWTVRVDSATGGAWGTDRADAVRRYEAIKRDAQAAR